MVKTQAHANPEGNFVVASGQSAVIKAVDLIAPVGQLIQKMQHFCGRQVKFEHWKRSGYAW
jgi:hypothetical protein